MLNIIYALISKKIKQDLDIYTFEALPSNYDRIIENCEINNFKNIKNYNTAISNKKEEVVFEYNYCSHTNTIEGKISVHTNNNLTKISIESNLIDNILNKKDMIILIKLDVEGNEINVLKKMTNLLKRNDYIILIEILEIQYKNTIEYIQTIIKPKFIYKST